MAVSSPIDGLEKTLLSGPSIYPHVTAISHFTFPSRGASRGCRLYGQARSSRVNSLPALWAFSVNSGRAAAAPGPTTQTS